jgi:hypothetical protein
MSAEYSKYFQEGIERLMALKPALEAHRKMIPREGWADDIGQILSEIGQQLDFDHQDKVIELDPNDIDNLAELIKWIGIRADQFNLDWWNPEWRKMYDFFEDLLFDLNSHVKRQE